MRLVSWNCCRGPLAAKGARVKALRPDLAVVQECARPQAEDRGWRWFGDNPRQGVGVWAASKYEVRALPCAVDIPRYAIPLQVTGARSFLLLAIWAQNDPAHPYVQAVIRAVELYRDSIASQPTVILGDFNSNAIWDRSRQDARDHSYLVSLLAELGLVSSYHRFYGEAPGAESQPTFYFQWNKKKPYHIDYCFIPEAWSPRLSKVRVGGYARWKAWSDHRPLVVDLADV